MKDYEIAEARRRAAVDVCVLAGTHKNAWAILKCELSVDCKLTSVCVVSEQVQTDINCMERSSF